MRVEGLDNAGGDSAGVPEGAVRGGPASGILTGDIESVRFATILFADIVGSTRLISALDPEDARDLLDSSIALIAQAIHDFAGMVVRVQGDGVMAVFGIHPAVEDHALRGAMAARAIVERMRTGPSGILPAPQARVGLHSGPILLRRQNNDFGSIIDVVGHAAHVAGQIEKLAPPASVAISATTVSLIAEPCQLEPVGTIGSDGDSEGGERGEAVFELASVEFAGSDRVPVKGNATNPLIGRDAEFAVVRNLIVTLRQNPGRSLGLLGEAGMGKSRLLLEAVRLSAGLGVTALVVRGNALLAAVPFGSLRGPVRHLLDLLRPFTPDPAAAAMLTPEQSVCLQGLVDNSATWLAHLAPGDRNHIATQTIVRLARLAVEHLPLLLLVDDVQYLDRESLAVLAGIREGGGVSMLAGGRPEAKDSLVTFCDDLIVLKPLPPSAARSLVALINRLAPLDEALIDNILDRAQGLPLALQEFAMSAQDGDAATFGSEGGDAAGRLPARLDALLGARLATLDDDATKLAQFCAALGPAFPLARLRQGAGLVCRNPQTAITRLVEARVVEFGGANQARFTHQLVQEAAYRTMARRRRTMMHTRALELLSAQGSAGEPGHDGDAASHAELASHAEKAGLTQRALGHLWDACQQALSLAAIDSVRQLYDRARTIAARLDPAPAAFEHARFSLLAYDTLQQLSCEQVTRPDMEAVATGKVDLGPGLRTVARINMALLDWIDGAPAKGEAWLAEAERDLASHESLPRRTYCDMVAAYLAYSQARPIEAIERIERIGNRLEDGQRGSTFGAVVVIPHVLARAFGAWYLTDLGDVAKARSWVAEALNLSRRYRHDYSRLLADLAHGYLHYREGRHDRALGILRSAYADCIRHHFLGFEPASASWLALTMIELGRLDEAEAVLGQSVDRGHFHHVRTSATYYLHEARARLALAKGEHERAAALAAEALAHCRSCGEVMHELHALVLCKEVEAATGITIAPAGDVTLDALDQRIRDLGIAPLMQRLAAIGKFG
ncbi:adenylate/guanylate cyclase domain-containing protein [Novosphingobium taihuense]|uniref:adenylate/guanylate cyclase domain-containing protein n=1 Tax=Novosphingobium taihuense TaxID=260085 RepID=UPI0013159CBC|nr:adenylate/guanylate cyclase domain-containing protein [Novosphingobium taihuense]